LGLWGPFQRLKKGSGLGWSWVVENPFVKGLAKEKKVEIRPLTGENARLHNFCAPENTT
jgi:hypothetical protein